METSGTIISTFLRKSFHCLCASEVLIPQRYQLGTEDPVAKVIIKTNVAEIP